MDGFKRPSRPDNKTYEQRMAEQAPTRQAEPVAEQLPADASVVDILQLDEPEQPKPAKKRRSAWKVAGVSMVIVLILALATGMLAWNWYGDQLKPVDSGNSRRIDISIEEGDSLSTVAEFLEKQGLIRSKIAFQINAQLNGKAAGIKKGNCRIAKSQSSNEILDILVKGCNDYKNIMFYPGATIEKPLYKPEGSEMNADLMYIKGVLARAGYDESAINKAFNKEYAGPLFEGKPSGTSLEGYVYGQTYHVPVDSTAEFILQTTFDQMYKDLEAEGLPAKFKAQGLNMYQAITLSSIVQRELNCEGKPTPERKDRCYQYQRTIAQIFLKRLKEDDVLGSDVTFIYAADMQGVFPTVNIDSPYNTRINKGLPPGPIAAPGLLALKAVGNPTDTDYHFFIAGDDGLIYFAKTVAEHEENIKNYCQKLCNEL